MKEFTEKGWFIDVNGVDSRMMDPNSVENQARREREQRVRSRHKNKIQYEKISKKEKAKNKAEALQNNQILYYVETEVPASPKPCLTSFFCFH